MNQEVTKACRARARARARAGAGLPSCKHSSIVGQRVSLQKGAASSPLKRNKIPWRPLKVESPLLESLAEDACESWVSLRSRVLYSLVKHEYIKNVHPLPVILSLLFYSYGSPEEAGRKQHARMSSWSRCWEPRAGRFRSLRALPTPTKAGMAPPESVPSKP